MVATTNSSGTPRQGMFGFLVREVAEGDGFRAGFLKAVVNQIERTNFGAPRVALTLEVDGLTAPLYLDLEPNDLAVSYQDEVIGVSLRGRSSVKMRVRAPRTRKIDRVRTNPTPRFPALVD